MTQIFSVSSVTIKIPKSILYYIPINAVSNLPDNVS